MIGACAAWRDGVIVADMKTISVLAIILSLALIQTHLYADTLSNGLVGYYPFNGGVADASGNGRDGTVYNTNNTILTIDRFGNPDSAYLFQLPADGVDPIIWGTNMDLAGKSTTISFWINGRFASDYDDYGGVGVGNVAPGTPNPGGSLGNSLHAVVNYANVIRFSFFYDDFDVPLNLVPNTWNQIAFTFDNSSFERTIAINGVTTATNTAAFGFSGTSLWQISGRNDVSMDDVRFYDRPLSSEEITQLYYAESVPEPSTYALLLLSGAASLWALKRRKS